MHGTPYGFLGVLGDLCGRTFRISMGNELPILQLQERGFSLDGRGCVWYL